jgi:1-deoxy-D-xylulose-5-phosphate synthase
MKKMKEDKTVAVITSATPAVMGFTEDKRKEAGKQFIDVGIAEEHAVAMASGIAANGGKPVYGVYSSFIQRTFDQLSQDLCINNNPVTIIVYTASVFGMNDVTHLGIYDIPLISNIPNMVYLAPTTKEEYLAMLDWSINQKEHPVAVRIPEDEFVSDGKEVSKDFGKLNKYEVTQSGSKVAVIGLGSFYRLGVDAAKGIEEKTGTKPTIINPYYITGIDTELLNSLKKEHDVVITLEDGILDGGFGQKIAGFYGNSDVKVLNYGLKKEFLDRYDVTEILEENHLTAHQITEDVLKLL